MLLGIIFLIAGFWKMVFFALLVGIGFVIGYQVDQKENLKQWIDDLFMDRWMRK